MHAWSQLLLIAAGSALPTAETIVEANASHTHATQPYHTAQALVPENRTQPRHVHALHHTPLESDSAPPQPTSKTVEVRGETPHHACTNIPTGHCNLRRGRHTGNWWAPHLDAASHPVHELGAHGKFPRAPRNTLPATTTQSPRVAQVLRAAVNNMLCCHKSGQKPSWSSHFSKMS